MPTYAEGKLNLMVETMQRHLSGEVFDEAGFKSAYDQLLADIAEENRRMYSLEDMLALPRNRVADRTAYDYGFECQVEGCTQSIGSKNRSNMGRHGCPVTLCPEHHEQWWTKNRNTGK